MTKIEAQEHGCQGAVPRATGRDAENNDGSQGEPCDISQGWDAYAQIAARVRQVWPAERTTQALLDEVR